jgi:hypothetical protein
MLFRKIFTVYFGNSIKQINEICGHMYRDISASAVNRSALKGNGALNLATD